MELENEKLIRKFLFGELSDDERFHFEERFITDADLFEEIKVVEDELIEKYVRGWMDSAEVSKFEQNFLTTNKRRERVEFSRQMLQKLEKQNESVVIPVKKSENDPAENISILDKITAFFLSPKIVMAGALALIIGVLGIWILNQNFSNGETEIAKGNATENTEIKPSIISPKPTESRKNNRNNSINNNRDLPTNNKENSDENTNNTPKPIPTPTPKKKDIKKTPTPKGTPPIQKTSPSPILALFSGTTRSGGKNNTLNLPKKAKSAILQLNLESVDYKSFQAQLTDANGNVIYQRGKLKIRKSKVNFNIPAKNLKTGDYIIKLLGKNDSGENESVADFQFRVNR